MLCTISWTRKFPYAFLPFCLIGRVVNKVEQNRARIILIIPRGFNFVLDFLAHLYLLGYSYRPIGQPYQLSTVMILLFVYYWKPPPYQEHYERHVKPTTFCSKIYIYMGCRTSFKVLEMSPITFPKCKRIVTKTHYVTSINISTETELNTKTSY